mmetsp:Transcript_10752/g.23723  ORF Transcript_10752/g.23723 Transcript_10752/m.23723 type:complete len:81 (+) Transcript_10752:128-370(+)
MLWTWLNTSFTEVVYFRRSSLLCAIVRDFQDDAHHPNMKAMSPLMLVEGRLVRPLPFRSCCCMVELCDTPLTPMLRLVLL